MVLSGTAAVVVVQPGTALPTELPEHEALQAGLEPATCRLVDNRNRSGPQQKVRRGHEMRSGRGVEPQRHTIVQPLSPDNRAASARDALSCWSRPARGRTRTSEVGARRASVYTTGLCRADDPDRTGLPGVAPRFS